MALRSQKPLVGARLKKNHPDALGLVLACPLNEGAGAPRDHISGAFGSSLGGNPFVWSSSPFGLGLSNAATTASTSPGTGFHFAPAGLSFAADPCTMEAWIQLLGTSSGGEMVVLHGGVPGFDQAIATDGSGDLIYGTAFTLPASAFLGQVMHVATVQSGGVVRAYRNGVFVGSAAKTYSAGPFTDIWLGAANSGQTIPPCRLLSVHVYKRALTADQILRRYQDPWGIYEQPRRRAIWVVLGSAKLGSDGASLTDASALSAAVPIADASALADAPSLSAATSVADASAFADAPTLSAATSVADASALADAPSLSAATSIADASALADAPTLSAASLVADASALADSPGLAGAGTANDGASITDSASSSGGTQVVSADASSLYDAATLQAWADLRQAVYSLLVGSSDLTGLVGNAIRIGPRSETDTLPSVSYSVLSDRKQHTLAGPNGWRNARVRIKCYGLFEADCAMAKSAIEGALDGYSGTVLGLGLSWVGQDAEADVPVEPRDDSDRWTYVIPTDYLIHYQTPQPNPR